MLQVGSPVSRIPASVHVLPPATQSIRQPEPQTDSDRISPAAAVAAAAGLLAAWLVTLDLLLGGLMFGAHLGSPSTGLPLFAVDAAGLAAYFALLFVPAALIHAAASRAISHLKAESAWRLSFAAPLVGLSLLFIRLGVGDGNPRVGEEGGRLVTALLVAAVLAPVPLLRLLRRPAISAPGRLAMLGMLLPASAGLAAVAAGSLVGSGRDREVRLLEIAVVAAWATAFALLSLSRRARQPLMRRPGLRRLSVLSLLFCGIPVLICAGRSLAHGGSGAGRGPSIVLVTFDAMRADRLSLYGGRVPAPHFQALAADGVTFDESRSQAPHTVASMTSLFSSLFPGQLPHSRRASNPARGCMIPAAHETLAEALAARGYATCAITANWTLGPQTGVLQGFSETVVMDHDWRRRNLFSQVLPGLEAVVQSAVRRPERANLMDSSTVALRYLRRFLDHHSRGPFFVWLHVMNPHDPYAPPMKYRRRLLRGDGPWPVFAPHDPSVGTPTDSQIRGGSVYLAEATRRYISDLYDCEVAHADDVLGRIRSAVEEKVGARPVIWCVTADHGEEFWDHGSYYHGHSLYDELVHVPLLISAPGAARGLRISQPVASMDVMPTLFELCRVPVPLKYEGHSLAAAVTSGKPPSPEPVFSDSNIYYEPAEAVTADGYKLVRHRVTKRLELFDLGKDPREQRNLESLRPEVAKRLARLLDKWDARAVPTGQAASAGGYEEDIRRLEALGYL